MKIYSWLCVIFVALGSVAGYAQSPREQLNQLVSQLRGNPSDTALRERIIGLAQEIKPPPAVPEEANRALVRGNVFQKEAKTPAGFELAISAYNDALGYAPWWGDAYYNLSIAQESAGKPDAAIGSLKLYLQTSPPESQAREAQNRIYAIEAKRELAGKERADLARAKEQAVNALVGLWYSPLPGIGPRGRRMLTHRVESIGDGRIRIRLVEHWNYYEDRGEVLMPDRIAVAPVYTLRVEGNKLVGSVFQPVFPNFSCPSWETDVTGEIQSGGRKLVIMPYKRLYITADRGLCHRPNDSDPEFIRTSRAIMERQ